jgi:hypothetical protein
VGVGRANHWSGTPNAAPSATLRKAPETLDRLIAYIGKTRERFMSIGEVLTMPIVFASNAIYPLSLMPDSLRVASRFNI